MSGGCGVVIKLIVRAYISFSLDEVRSPVATVWNISFRDG